MKRSYFSTKGKYCELADYYAKEIENLEITIPKHLEVKINNIIRSKGNFYSYGGYRNMCVLIVSPKKKIAIYLYRD